jgi:hypothetical protein
MSSKPTIQDSSSINSVLCRMSPPVPTGSRFFFSQVLMTITVLILLVAYLPCISSSPTPSSIQPENNNNNKILMFDPIDYQTGLREDSSSSSVHEQPLWYAQPRTNANQFLTPNDNDMIVPKWYTRFNNDDDIDDYIPSGLLVNKRSSFFNTGGYSTLKKRKQLAKPPMEVMNEIVNSIYLKR